MLSIEDCASYGTPDCLTTLCGQGIDDLLPTGLVTLPHCNGYAFSEPTGWGKKVLHVCLRPLVAFNKKLEH